MIQIAVATMLGVKTGTSPMIIFDIVGAALVIAMLGAMISDDTRDNRIRIAH
jgi:hypothetical protein